MAKHKRTIEERFWKKVSKVENGCWLWTAAIDHGYGRFTIAGKYRRAHRVSWNLHNGEIPEGLFVLHKCDVRSCVNPSHLFLGTTQENMDDMVAKDRQSRGEGHAFSKLTASKVVEIRAKYADGGVTQRGLASMFGVSKTAIAGVIRLKTWSHV